MIFSYIYIYIYIYKYIYTCTQSMYNIYKQYNV